MSLGKKILLIVGGVLIALIIAGLSIYNFIIVPKYIEPVLTSASELLKDSEIQETLTTLAEDLADQGVIDNTTLKNYMKKAKKYSKNTDIYSMQNTDEKDAAAQSGSRITTTGSGSKSSSVVSSTKSSLGITEVRSMDEEDDLKENAKINQSYSKKFSEDNIYSLEQADDEMEYSLDSAVTDEKAAELEVKEAIGSSRASRLYDKIIKAMSAKERSVFFSVIGKADTNTLISLYQTSDRAGAKQYLQSILDNGEYSEAVEIFFKYAPLLLEE